MTHRPRPDPPTPPARLPERPRAPGVNGAPHGGNRLGRDRHRAVFIAAYLIMLFGSFKRSRTTSSLPPTYLPEQWHPENYVTMWSTPRRRSVQT